MATIDDVFLLLRDIESELTGLIAGARINPNQININVLADLSHSLGTVTAGEFRTGNGLTPGGGFTGVRMAFPAMPYSIGGSETWNIAGVANDVLKTGINAVTGLLYATDATIAGTITANAGTIGGWTIDSQNIYSLDVNSFGIALNSLTARILVGNTLGTYIELDGLNKWIRSSNYSAGASGFIIYADTGNAEFNNIKARGVIHTAVFQKDVISAVGGQFLVLPADTLDVDMGPEGAATLTTKGIETFAVGDILRMKDENDDEWFVVTSIASAPTYVVMRDMAGQYSALEAIIRDLSDGDTRVLSDGDTRVLSEMGRNVAPPDVNPSWKKGQAIVNYGPSGSGGLLFVSGASPALYLFNHEGQPWNVVNNEVVLSETGITAGDGTLTLDRFGMSLTSGAALEGTNSLDWYTTGDLRFDISSFQETFNAQQTNTAHVLVASAHASDLRHVLYLEAGYPNYTNAQIALDTGGNAHQPQIQINSNWLGNGFADVDTLINGVHRTVIFVDAGFDAVGIGASFGPSDPRFRLAVWGGIYAQTDLTVDRDVQFNGTLQVGHGIVMNKLDAYFYVPTVTWVTNVAGATPRSCYFTQIHNVVHVYGEVDIDPTAAGETVFELTLPVASQLAYQFDLAGVGALYGASSAITPVRFFAATGSKQARGHYSAPDGTNRTISFQFSYVIRGTA